MTRAAGSPGAPATSRDAVTGTVWVAVGLGIYGLSNFVLLGLSGRELGPAAAAPVAVVWTLLNALGYGLFTPLEQEIGRRVAAARAVGSQAPWLGDVTRYALYAILAIALLGFVGFVPISNLFLSGSRPLVGVLVLGIAAFAFGSYSRGLIAGTGRFRRYGAQFAVDGVVRMIGAAALFVALGGSQLSYAVLLVLAPIVATLVTVPLREISPGALSPALPKPEVEASCAGVRSTTHSQPPSPLGHLVLTSITSQLLANAGPIVIAMLATAAEQAASGQFIAAVTIARIPLFLWAAIQAFFLPSLAALVATRNRTGFAANMRKGGAAAAVIGVTGVLGVAALGPWAMNLVYGPHFVIARSDMILIAVSGAIYMGSLVLAQGLHSHYADRAVAAGWSAGIVATALALFAPLSLTTLVATALCTGSVVALVSHAIALRRVLKGFSSGSALET